MAWSNSNKGLGSVDQLPGESLEERNARIAKAVAEHKIALAHLRSIQREQRRNSGIHGLHVGPSFHVD